MGLASLTISFNLFCLYLDMNDRHMVSGTSSFRGDRQDADRGQKNVNRSGNVSGDESSDSSSTVNNKERGRKKQKNSSENRKEQIQGNASLFYIVRI